MRLAVAIVCAWSVLVYAVVFGARLMWMIDSIHGSKEKPNVLEIAWLGLCAAGMLGYSVIMVLLSVGVIE